MAVLALRREGETRRSLPSLMACRFVCDHFSVFFLWFERSKLTVLGLIDLLSARLERAIQGKIV
jgi:hypothetical protein